MKTSDLQKELRALATRAAPKPKTEDMAERIQAMLLGIDALYCELACLAADEGLLDEVFPLVRRHD